MDFASYTPTYEGNTLYGWYLSDGSPWPGARKVSGDVTLRAKWSVTEEAVTYKLSLLNGEDPVPLEYDNGVFQFTIVSSIYGGYAQRSGKYTVYEDGLTYFPAQTYRRLRWCPGGRGTAPRCTAYS